MDNTNTSFVRSVCSCEFTFDENDHNIFTTITKDAQMNEMKGYEAIRQIMLLRQKDGREYYSINSYSDARLCCLNTLFLCKGTTISPNYNNSSFKMIYKNPDEGDIISESKMVSNDDLVTINGFLRNDKGLVAHAVIPGTNTTVPIIQYKAPI